MPITVFGNSSSSHDNFDKIGTSLFVRKPQLRTNYIESDLKDIYLKNEYRIKNLPDPISIREAASKIYVNIKLNDPSIIKNTADVEFIDKKLHNVRFIKVNSIPTLEEHQTSKMLIKLYLMV